jgi:diguanylate cyclase (GGDEF)-like protein
VFVPAVIVINAIACTVLLARREGVTALSMWLSVAMIASILDALLNLGAARYSYAWDTGKIITVFTASIVLIMILCDVVGLYGQLARVARIDDLTALQNRLAFEEHFNMMLQNARRLRGSLALFFVKIDGFKRFEGKFGRLAGDECLRRVAWELVGCATRPLDVVARYGDEKFAVLLPDMHVEGALVVAERIRNAVENLAISHRGKALGAVTVSIGIAYTANARCARDASLFEAADRALIEAREHGGNGAVLGSVDAIDEFAPEVAGLGVRAK